MTSRCSPRRYCTTRSRTLTPAPMSPNTSGETIAGLVLEVTDDKSLPKAERKRLQIEHAPHLSPGAKLIKLADKICNLRDVRRAPPAGWSLERRRDYFDWARSVIDGLRGADSRLEAIFDAEYAVCCRFLHHSIVSLNRLPLLSVATPTTAEISPGFGS